MSFLSRVATAATFALSLAGALASSPGWATGTDQGLVTTPALQTLNTLAPQMVPAVEPVAPASIVTPASVPMVQPVPADDPEFETLDAAVAAQASEAKDEATRCLAGAIYFEAKGEPLNGQLAVAEVILNRAKSGRYPPDVCSVIKQRGQFSFVRGGQIPAIDTDGRAYRTAVAVARVAMDDMWDSKASDAMFFNATRHRPSGAAIKVASIGNHVFYR